MFWITQMHEICKQFGRVLYEEYVMSLRINRIHFNQAVYVYAGSLPANSFFIALLYWISLVSYSFSSFFEV